MNPQLARDLKAIEFSAELVDSLTIFRKSLDEAIKQKALEASRNLKTNTRGRQLLMLFKIDEILPLKETDLSSIRDLLSEHDRLKAGR
jgi:hypothetical protein